MTLQYIFLLHPVAPTQVWRHSQTTRCRLRFKCDGTRAETRFRLSEKRTSPFKSAGASVQSATCRRAVHISLQGVYCSCKPVFCSHVTLVTPSILLSPLHFSSRASPCAITFQLDSTSMYCVYLPVTIQLPCLVQGREANFPHLVWVFFGNPLILFTFLELFLHKFIFLRPCNCCAPPDALFF